MAIDFPNSPSLDQVFTDPTSGKAWKWDGEKWIVNITGLTANDIPNSSITAAKLNVASSGSTGNVLTRNTGVTSGFEWASISTPSNFSLLNQSFSTVTVSNTTSESNVLSYSLSGATANSIIRVNARGTWLNNTGSNLTYTFRFKLGSTTILASDNTTQFGSATTSRRWYLQANIHVNTLTSQETSAFFFGTTGSSVNWGPQSSAFPIVGNGTSSENLSTAKNIIFSVQMGTASTSANFVMTGYAIEKIN